MRTTGSRPRANSSTPMLDRGHKSSFGIRGNDKDNGGDDDIVLSSFTAEPQPNSANVAVAPEFTTISLDIALERKLQRAKRKMDLATSRLNNISRNGGDTKQARQELGGDADAVVAHRDRDFGFVGLRHREQDLAAGLGVLARVVQQVGKHLGEPRFIAFDDDRFFRHDYRHAVPRLIELRLHGGHREIDDVRQLPPRLEQRQLARGDPADIEQIVD